MAPPKLDPWTSPSEWQKVYSLLYSPDEPSKREGISFVRMWSARSQRLPLSVECTGELVAASLESGDKTAQISVYSLAIIRFVNGNIDRAQGGVFARSVASVAAGIGIPDWIIDIRHEGTHKSLPCRERLRMAAQYAIYWLEEKYWKPQNQCLENAERKVQDCLAGYMELQKRLEGMKRAGKKTNKTEITLLVEQISSLSQYELGLLPSRLVKCLEDTSFSFLTWKPLLLQLDKNKPNVVAHIIYVLCENYAINFQHRLKITKFVESIISEDLFGDPSINQHSLYVDVLLKNQNDESTWWLSNVILHHCGTHVTGKYAKLRNLLEIRFQPKSSAPFDNDDISKQVENLKHVLAQLEKQSPNIGADMGSRFVTCDSVSWECLPIGCTPESITPSLDFESVTPISDSHQLQNNVITNPSSNETQSEDDYEMEIDQVKNLRCSRYITKDQLTHIACSVRILDDLD